MLGTLADRRCRHTASLAVGRAQWAEECRTPAAELVWAADRLLAQGRRQLLTVVVARGRREVLPDVATAVRINEKLTIEKANKREARPNSRAFHWRQDQTVQEPVGLVCDINACKSRDTCGSFLRLVRPTFLY
jgi:hypothetical protein